MYKIIIKIALFVLFYTTAFAHENCISGRILVKNGKSEPVVGATIRIANTMLGTITDRNGYFHLRNIPKGSYELTITAVGLKPLRHKFSIDTDLEEDLVLNFELEETSIITPDVVVTATRSEKIYEDTPVKVSVLTDRVFESTSSVSLKEGLNFQPGLRTETNCQNCGFSQVRINGLEGKYSQILIDGKAIFSALNGVYGLEQLPVNMIDRIEVVRGGGSSLYGGNAIAGVINIITKEPAFNFFNADFTQGISTEGATDNTISLNGSIINESQNLGLFIFGMNRDRDDLDLNNDGFSDIGRLHVKNFGGRAFYKPSFRSKIIGQFNTLYHEIRGGDSLHLMPHFTNITEMTTHRTNSGQLQYETYLSAKMNKLSLYSSFQMTDRQSYYGANKDPNAYGSTDNETYALGVQYSQLFENLAGSHILTAGYEFNYDWMMDLAPAYNRTIDQTTRSHGFYLQDDWSISERFNLIWGSRFDKHNKIDNLIISPRANILYKLMQNLSFRGSISTGYRAPQAFDEDLHITQVGGDGIVIQVDEDLKPEYSLSFGSSLDYSFRLFGRPFAISLEYFHTTLSDAFILEDDGRDEKGNLIMARRNGENAIVTGTTFEIQTELISHLDFKTGITYQKSKYDTDVEWSAGDESEGIEAQYSKYIFRTPDLYGFFTLNYDVTKNLAINLSGIYTGAMYVPHYAGYIEEDELKKTDPFFELNSKLSYRLMNNPNLEISLGFYNILNSFQKDLDKGADRDAGYLYGPSRPRTIFWSIKTSL